MSGSNTPMTLRRRVLCYVLLALIFANMVVIFLFSTEPSGDSGERSEGVTRQIVSVVVKDFEEMEPSQQEAVVEEYHPVIRKLAHFLEFASLGFLCGAFAWAWKRGKYWMWWVVPATFCLAYAAADEIHQIFTGRGSSVRDVMLDFTGSVVGLALIHLVYTVAMGIYARRQTREGAQCKSQDTV